jgi:sugar lactone lactonase YvrE
VRWSAAEQAVGSGFAEHTDPAALVVGPTGVAFSSERNTLYVADTAANRITAIPQAEGRMTSAGTGPVVTRGDRLRNPLGLVLAPNGDLISANASNGRVVETIPAGTQSASRVVDATGMPPGAGTLFGLAIAPHHQLYFVDDGTNTLDLLH